MQTSQRGRWRFLATLKPQFSLRLLILLVTLFAIGFPIWYRWPYEITDSPGGLPSSRTTTWQRQWGGGKLKHGPTIATQGPMTQSSMYRNDKLHGPYVAKVRDRYVQRGQFVDGHREGDWTDGNGDAAVITHWLHGQLHGPITFKNNHGHSLTAIFEHGRLTSVNGKPWSGSTYDTLKNREIDEKTANELNRQTDIDVVEMPLTDTVLYLSDKHGILIVIDPKTIAKPDLPLTACLRGIDLQSALSILLALHDLACDYRYGCLWITTPQDVADWTDRTGMEAIQPPQDSDVARAWNEPVKLDLAQPSFRTGAQPRRTPSKGNVSVQRPSLQTALDALSQQLAITIDSSPVALANDPARYPVTLQLSGLPFRHVLGQVLYQTNCRCRLENETLVILPP